MPQLDPATHPLGIGSATELASRVEEDHDQLATSHFGLHHQALTGLRDVTRFLQVDAPVGIADQTVGGFVFEGAAAHLHIHAHRGAEFAHGGVVGSKGDQGGQVFGTGLVAAGQACGFCVFGVAHAQLLRFGIHLCNECGQTLWIGATLGVGCAVFAGHERQMQEFTTGERDTRTQARGAAFFSVDVF